MLSLVLLRCLLQGSRCQSVDIAEDVSFDTASYAGSGRTSPTGLLHMQQQQQQRPHSTLPQQSQNAHKQQQSQRRAASASPCASTTDVAVGAAARPWSTTARPWSTAATQAARRLFGRQAMQLQLQTHTRAAGQQQQRSKSAQPYYSYSIDTRLMSRSNGCFRCAASEALAACDAWRI
jgi:hypothetical protein